MKRFKRLLEEPLSPPLTSSSAPQPSSAQSSHSFDGLYYASGHFQCSYLQYCALLWQKGAMCPLENYRRWKWDLQWLFYIAKLTLKKSMNAAITAHYVE